MNAAVYALFALSLFAVGYAGKVGECRTECAEQNAYKIVRVHLRETNVSAGVCQNTSNGNAKVVEFICDLKVGIWLPDLEAEEPFSFFPSSCPAVTMVEESEIDSCPGAEFEMRKTLRNLTSKTVAASADSNSTTEAAASPAPKIEPPTESNNTTVAAASAAETATSTEPSKATEAVPVPALKKVEKTAMEPIKTT